MYNVLGAVVLRGNASIWAVGLLALIGAIVLAVKQYKQVDESFPETFEESTAIVRAQADAKSRIRNPLTICCFIAALVFTYCISVSIGAMILICIVIKIQYKEKIPENDETGRAYPVVQVREDKTAYSGICKDIPFDGHIPAAIALILMTEGEKERSGALIGTYLTKWVLEGKIQIKKARKDYFGATDLPAVFFISEPDESDKLEHHLYIMLQNACGNSEFMVDKEFGKWVSKSATEFRTWENKVYLAGKQYMYKNGYIDFIARRTFVGLDTYDAYTEKGMKTVNDLKGFRNFINKKANQIDKEDIPEEMWKDYMIISRLFGKADQAAVAFMKKNPEYFKEQFVHYEPFDIQETFDCIKRIGKAGTDSAVKAAQKAASKSSLLGSRTNMLRKNRK